MQVEEELARYRVERDTLLSIGVFDGVHLGHRHLLGHLRDRAAELRLVPGVVTFSTHPRQVLHPESGVTYLTPLEERLELLRATGMEVVVTLPFTVELASLEAAAFLFLLQHHLHLKGLVIGPDFALGRGRQGDAARLEALSRELGFTLEQVPPVTVNGEVVSSTAIRHALGRGEVERVSRFLGRPFTLSGQVVTGAERGRSLGFPTANLALPPQQALPADGVYVTRARVAGRTLDSVTNIGLRPTFNTGERTVEVFLLDFEGDLYGQHLTIELVARLREERRFDSPAQLVSQMEQDVAQARRLLAGARAAQS